MLMPATLDPQARAQAALADSPIYALRELRVERDGATLTLLGSVETFYYKQMAQELLKAIAADCNCELVNAVAVDYRAESFPLHPR
jgi:hypothetical protein